MATIAIELVPIAYGSVAHVIGSGAGAVPSCVVADHSIDSAVTL